MGSAIKTEALQVNNIWKYVYLGSQFLCEYFGTNEAIKSEIREIVQRQTHKALLQKSQLSPAHRIFEYELGAALAVQHPGCHFLFHLLSSLNAESSLNPVRTCFS